MTRSKILLGVILVLALTFLSGMIHGRMSYRWGKTADMKLAATKLEQIPKSFGPWELRGSEELDPEVANVLECAGYIVRTYVDGETGDQVNMFVLLGPPGPTAAHTPDICYNSRAYKNVQEKEPWQLESGQQEHVFWGETLESVDVTEGLLRVYHAWSAGTQWQAPENSRFAFGAEPYLYKVQLASPLLKLADAGTDTDPGRRFLKDFVPAAQPFLVPPK